jgi:hypothetical protein
MAKGSKKSKGAKRERREQRFLPRATTNPVVVYVIAGVGGLVTGAGVWAQWGRVALLGVSQSADYAPWLLAASAVILGVAIWFGTSGDPALRVGDGGVAVEKNGLRRIPWHQADHVTYDGARAAIVVKGRDEAGSELSIAAPLGSQPQAAAWIVREARERVPGVVEVDESLTLAQPVEDEAAIVRLDPVQVVGKRCAASGTILAFEPDARVCPRCERVYHRVSVPETCACGASLEALRGDEKKDEAARPADVGSAEAHSVG